MKQHIIQTPSLWTASALSNPCWNWKIRSDQTSSETPPSHRLGNDKHGCDVAKREWFQTLHYVQRREGSSEWLHLAPSASSVKDHTSMLCLPGLFSARSYSSNLRDLTERSKIRWPVNPADQAFVTGASWALFGKGLALGAVRNDQQGLKRGSTGPPAKPIRARPRLLSGGKLTLGKLSLKAKVYNTIQRKGQPLRSDQQ